MKVIVGCERSQAVTIELRRRGHKAYSCDLLPCLGGHPEWHIQDDILNHLDGYDMGIFFPDCTYLTCSAEWAYKDSHYHQNIKPGTLVGQQRRDARDQAIEFVLKLWNSGIEKVSIENPIGVLSSRWMKPTQIIQPYQFGDDASKKTCLWLKGLPLLVPTNYVQPRYVDSKPRWANQTDSGQNKLSPSDDRARIRGITYPGIAKAMAEQWTKNIL